ncbi:hypothetical protein BROUX41_003723 [Berkeleyomyces rouxiae]|uniref:uncharacterized protein n=1 Tax=Berkeleyomyces rouxiae TaxID=2035830 RepID=UPI003B77DEB3
MPSSCTSSASIYTNMNTGPVSATVETIRCLRCAATAEITTTDDLTATTGMVRVGHGIYYCRHCAQAVGYGHMN